MATDIDSYIGIYTVINKFLHPKSEIALKTDSRGHIELKGKRFKSNTPITLKIVYSDWKPKESKVFGKNIEWGMSRKDEQIQDKHTYYCFIHFDKINATYKYYIVPNDKVVKYLKYEHHYWLIYKLTRKDNSYRIFRLGLFYQIFNPHVLMAYDFEDKWDQLK